LAKFILHSTFRLYNSGLSHGVDSARQRDFFLQRDTRKIQPPRMFKPQGPSNLEAAAFEALFAGAAAVNGCDGAHCSMELTVICSCVMINTWQDLGLWLYKALFPSFPSPSQLCRLPRFNMSGTHVLPGAHHFGLSNCTINAASTVRETQLDSCSAS